MTLVLQLHVNSFRRLLPFQLLFCLLHAQEQKFAGSMNPVSQGCIAFNEADLSQPRLA